MNNIVAAIRSESLKVWRSKIFWISFLFFAFMPVMMGFMNFVMQNPDLANKIGLIASGTKLEGSAEWTSFLDSLGRGMMGMGAIGFAFVGSWIFGREYTDRTVKDLLALPISRSRIVLAKLIVAFVWCYLLTLFMGILSFFIGNVLNLGGGSIEVLFNGFLSFVVTAILTMIISIPAIFLANISRGFLLPIGVTLLAVILGNFIGALGFSQFYPWTIPAFYQSTGQLGIASWIILSLTGIFGLIGTFAWWRFADQH